MARAKQANIKSLQRQVAQIKLAAASKKKSTNKTRNRTGMRGRRSGVYNVAEGISPGGPTVMAANSGELTLQYSEKWADVVGDASGNLTFGPNNPGYGTVDPGFTTRPRTGAQSDGLLYDGSSEQTTSPHMVFWPGNSGLGRLDIFSAMYDLYQLKSIKLRYLTSTGTVQSGEILLGVDYDPKDVATTARGAEEYVPRFRAPLWKNGEMTVPVDRAQKAKWMYTSSGTDTMAESLGPAFAVVLGGHGVANTAVGSLWVDYKLVLQSPAPSQSGAPETSYSQAFLFHYDPLAGTITQPDQVHNTGINGGAMYASGNTADKVAQAQPIYVRPVNWGLPSGNSCEIELIDSGLFGKLPKCVLGANMTVVAHTNQAHPMTNPYFNASSLPIGSQDGGLVRGVGKATGTPWYYDVPGVAHGSQNILSCYDIFTGFRRAATKLIWRVETATASWFSVVITLGVIGREVRRMMGHGLIDRLHAVPMPAPPPTLAGDRVTKLNSISLPHKGKRLTEITEDEAGTTDTCKLCSSIPCPHAGGTTEPKDNLVSVSDCVAC